MRFSVDGQWHTGGSDLEYGERGSRQLIALRGLLAIKIDFFVLESFHDKWHFWYPRGS